MKVSLFVTCIVDQLFPDVGVSMVRLLRRYGCEVDFPASQTCCGQPPFNSGYVKEARAIAANHLRAFDGADYVVSPSGSCTGMVHHYYKELFPATAPVPSVPRSGDSSLPPLGKGSAGEGLDPALAEKAAKLAERSYEFSSFLVNVLGVTDVGAVCPHTVTFHPSCHASRLLGVRDEPTTLLENVRDIKLVPLPYATDCCGFGGTFSVKMSDVSGAMVSEKVDHVAETGAEYLVGTDMGCLINIGGHMKRRGMSTKVMHLAQFLETFSNARNEVQGPRVR